MSTTETPWTAKAQAVASCLSPAQVRLVKAGTVCGDFQMPTVLTLKRKGIFFHHITSPNGNCGPMKLTDFGKQVQAVLACRDAQ